MSLWENRWCYRHFELQLNRRSLFFFSRFVFLFCYSVFFLFFFFFTITRYKLGTFQQSKCCGLNVQQANLRVKHELCFFFLEFSRMKLRWSEETLQSMQIMSGISRDRIVIKDQLLQETVSNYRKFAVKYSRFLSLWEVFSLYSCIRHDMPVASWTGIPQLDSFS